jgi:hypothetical protein
MIHGAERRGIVLESLPNCYRLLLAYFLHETGPVSPLSVMRQSWLKNFSPYTTRERRHPTHIPIFEVLEDTYSFRAGSGHDDDIHIENGADLIHIPGYLARAD